jgi:tellurite resistance protein TerA
MKNILKGQKLSIEKEILSGSFIIGLSWDQSSNPNYDIDASVMLLSERGKLEEEGNFVFYNNLNSLSSEVKMHSSPVGNYKKTFHIDLKKVSSDVSRIIFIITIDNGDSLNHRFGGVKSIKADLVDEMNQNAVLRYEVEDLTKETAVILLELYKRNNEWKIQAVGNGFNAGLAAILKEYGSEKVSIDNQPQRNAAPIVAKKEDIAPTKVQPSISLSKITLEKKGDSTKIDLSKHDVDKSEIHINLNWNQGNKKSGFFRKVETLDLDLGCMYEMIDGGKGVIQALGNSFGSKYTYPYIYLDKDDRTGSSTDGENLYIYRPDLLKKAGIFSFIYEGHSDFLEAGSVLTIKGLNQEITIKLDSPRPHLKFCIGALIENVNGTIKIQKIDEYVLGHRECDGYFGFNFRWVAGAKD